MKIGIFGGSFNPIHKGHIKIAQDAITSLKLDKLYFVPAYKSPFKNQHDYADANDRVNMIKLVLTKSMEISMFEINRKGVSYTIDTVKYFANKYKNDQLFLLMGTDNLAKLHKWKDIEKISQLTTIIIFKRQGSWSKVNIKRFNCLLLNNALYNYSSTLTRQGHMDNIDRQVAQYIGKHYLYINDIMLAMLDHKRYKHSVSVAQYAAKYAKIVGVSAKKAWVAGSLHDITKCLPKKWHQDFLLKYNIDDIPDYKLHACSAYYWLRDFYYLKDQEILQAVIKHTSLAKEMSLMDKVLFAADKLCDGRRHHGIQEDRKLILRDFDQGFRMSVRAAYGIVSDKRDLQPEQKDIYLQWM